MNYLRESLANYSENEMCQQIFQKLDEKIYSNEVMFVKALDEEEMTYLNDVLENELYYAKSVEHDQRVKELTEVYELLF
ncbi:sporulation protein [Virgibacillus halodenitrificans]|uniref:sporulation protein n=1 Tax=Virgibacillus halodenitrificans TaxID=1482 RepID=UPI0019267DF5|nr:sporulation protein [Virgibacillus halodenitrificans]